MTPPRLLSLLIGDRCAICTGHCPASRVVCARCSAALSRTRPLPTRLADLDLAWSAAPYEGAARELVAALKFRGRLPLARLAAETIAARAPRAALAGTVVPVPPARLRARRRGYDAAELIAIPLALLVGSEFELCLRRADGWLPPRQVGRPRADRVGRPPRVRLTAGAAPRRVVLVDDVLTTGATLGACARALRSGGAQWVGVVTFARSLPPAAGPLGSRGRRA